MRIKKDENEPSKTGNPGSAGGLSISPLAKGMLQPITPEHIKALIDTALGKVKSDLVITDADLVNVYSGELLKGQSVAIKGDRIAYVGEKADHTIGPHTHVIDATGKTLIPGLIDGHTHIVYCTPEEFLKYVMRGGTTAVITEIVGPAVVMGYRGVMQLLESLSDQPIKIFATAPSMPALSPAAQLNYIHPRMMKKLLKQKEIVGLGETFWQYVLLKDDRILQLFNDTLNLGKTLEGHSAGARSNKLVAYIASGISSCHESVTAEDVLERLRLGIHTMIREGYTRKDMEAVARIVARIKEKKVDCRRLTLATDSVSPQHLMEQGYMEYLVQKAIDLGFDPIVAIQMATINTAEHFSLDGHIGGIAPGKYADMVLIPDLQTIRAETVISNGQIIAQKGQLLIPPRGHTFSRPCWREIHLPGKLEPADFRIPTDRGDKPVTVRVIDMVADTLTRKKRITMTPKRGLLETDIEDDILKVAVIERKKDPGRIFTGFIKGFGMKKGAFASSATWDLSGIVVVGTNDEDMAGAVNRIFSLQGGAVVYAGGRVLAELPMPIGGLISDLPMETLCQRSEEVQQSVTELGSPLADAHLSLTALTTAAIPFFRICEAGYMDIKEGKVVGLMVS